jgi:hypothetical protein
MFSENIYRRYSVLPALNKLPDEFVFSVDADRELYRREKQKSLNEQCCVFEHDITSEIYGVICNYIVQHSEVPLQPGTFAELAMQLQDDLVIHRRDENRDWFAAAHICFPSGWDPAEKIGKPFAEIHAPIPGMDLTASPKLVDTMIRYGPFERFVWSVMHERRLNNHPRLPKKHFDRENPTVLLKLERQITIGFPEIDAVLFVLRQYFLEDYNRDVLFNAVLQMNAAERKYKDVDDNLIAWLERQQS